MNYLLYGKQRKIIKSLITGIALKYSAAYLTIQTRPKIDFP